MLPPDLVEEKKFYERFWALYSDPDLVAVFARFGFSPFRRSSVLEGFSGFVDAQAFRGHRCVEIGTWKGLTALILARHFDEVVSIDIAADQEKHQIVENRGVKNIRFINVKDNAEKAAVMGSLKFDAAYLDGDHARDTETDFDLVRRCGRVLFHEFWEVQPPVWNLVNQLRSQGTVTTKNKLALWTA